MIEQLLLGTALISITILIKAGFIIAAMKVLTKLTVWVGPEQPPWKLAALLTGTAIWLVLALTIAVWTWAGVFLSIGAFDQFESALYFSVVAFTTLGFGDITLNEDWRLLSGLIAANGLILFSLTTAFLIETLRAMARSHDS